MKTVAMIGAGAWGTAVSTVLAGNGHRVNLWCRETTVVDAIQKTKENSTFLPGVQLSENIIPTDSLETALHNVEAVFFAVPVQYSRTVLESCKPFFNKDQIWVFLNKGIEQETLLLPTQIAQQVLDADMQTAVVVGPSFAKDLAQKQMTGVMCAVDNEEIYKTISDLLNNKYFQMHETQDIDGVQLCAALKNVIAFGVGMLEGQGYQGNAKIYFVMKALQEMEYIVSSCGGIKESVYSFAGIGDVMLTALGKESRNLKVGRKLGAGQSLTEILNEMNAVPEGVNTARSLELLLNQQNIKTIIFKKVIEFLQNEKRFSFE